MEKAKLSEFSLPYPGRGDRRIRVYVPAHEEGERLPVIYMTDGQNLFDAQSCTWGCWRTIEAVEESMKNGSSGAVIVGIDHGGRWRDNELTPRSIGTVLHAGEMENCSAPEGEVFDRFAVESVMPYVEAHFPVRTGAKYTAVCGSSSGGLQCFFTGLLHSGLFSMIGAFSPAMMLYSVEDIRAWILSRMADDMPYIYLYSGMADELEERIFACADSTYDILTEIGYPCDRLNEVIMPGYRHNEDAWAEIFRDFLHTFLYRAGD